MTSEEEGGDEGEWFSKQTIRKRFREEKEAKEAPPKKKRKTKIKETDELAVVFWEDQSSSLECDALEEFSNAILSSSGKSLNTNCKEEDDPPSPKIDLYAESAIIQKELRDCSVVSIPSKEEISKRKAVLQRRVEREKYDSVVRVRKERESLPGHKCEMCQQFYDAIGDDVIDKSSFIMSCSKHRYNYSPPPTPPGYWDLDFPEEEVIVKEESKQYSINNDIEIISNSKSSIHMKQSKQKPKKRNEIIILD